MKRIRKLPRSVQQEPGYFPGNLRSDRGMRKHRDKGRRGSRRKQTITLAKV